jgi:hypothetical protein
MYGEKILSVEIQTQLVEDRELYDNYINGEFKAKNDDEFVAETNEVYSALYRLHHYNEMNYSQYKEAFNKVFKACPVNMKKMYSEKEL